MQRRTTSRQIRFRRSLGNLLRGRRQELMLSQGELADAVAVTQASISNYETGRSEAPLSILLCLCKELRLHPAELVAYLDIEHDDGRPMLTQARE